MTGSTLAALLGHAWRRHRVTMIAISVAVGLLEFIFTRMAPLPNQVNWMALMLQTLSQEVQDMLGNEAMLSSGGFLALGYVHPFFILVTSVWVVRVSSAAVAGEVGRGTMDLLASRPVPRWQLIAAGFITLAAGLVVIVGAGFVGTAIGLQFRALDVRPAAFAPVAAAAFLLFAAWGAVGLAISAMRRDASQAIAWTTAVIAVSFVLDYLARLWPTIARLRSISLFRYYEPQALLSAGVQGRAVLVLGTTLVVAYLVAAWAVRNRDL